MSAWDDYLARVGRVYSLYHGGDGTGDGMKPYEDEVTVFDSDGNAVRCAVRVLWMLPPEVRVILHFAVESGSLCATYTQGDGQWGDTGRSAGYERIDVTWTGERRFDAGTLYPLVRTLYRQFLAHQDAP